MQHFSFENSMRRKQIFYKEPEAFTKYTEKEVLSFALGATLYMPATKKNIAKDVIEKKYSELSSMVIDLEDAVGDKQLEEAEQLLIEQIREIYEAIEEQKITIDDLPLIFVRLRTPKQMKVITNGLGVLQRVLTGYVFPKFSYENGKEFLEILKSNNKDDIVLYGMPILETAEIIYKETRMEAIHKIKQLLDEYREYILNVRIGATDFCGLFGIRRKVETTIYDISVIRDCLADIINVFNRKESGYIISGPVWEFFSKEHRILKPQLRTAPFNERFGTTGLKKRTDMINQYIDGLITEVILDKLNGLHGKTIIHPSHIRPVHALYVVTHEEYVDALSILANSDGEMGVIKSTYDNKMNEMKPHHYWAEQIMIRAKIFGVFYEDQDFTSLLVEEKSEKELHGVK